MPLVSQLVTGDLRTLGLTVYESRDLASSGLVPTLNDKPDILPYHSLSSWGGCGFWEVH